VGEVEVADVVPRVKAQRDKDGRIKNGERETGGGRTETGRKDGVTPRLNKGKDGFNGVSYQTTRWVFAEAF